jgi:cyclase
MRRISPRIFVETEYEGATFSAIKTSRGFVLVDCPYKPESCLEFASRLRRISPREVALVVLTDHHFDHVSTAGFFGAGIVINERSAPDFETQRSDSRRRTRTVTRHGGPLARVIAAMELPRPRIVFSDRVSFDMGDLTVRVIRVGGHTPGTSVVFVPEERIVFCGDTLVNGALPYLGQGNFREWAAALRLLLAMEADLFVPGHGEPCDQGLLRALLRSIGSLEAGAARLAEDVRSKRVPARAGEKLLSYFPRSRAWPSPSREARIEAVSRMYAEITGKKLPGP